jgi:NhaP-type Na+/H+ or K+/H+ antiporter
VVALAAVLHLRVPMLVPASATNFEAAVLVLGLLLVAAALLSGVARESFVSLTALFVLVGFVLGNGALGVLHFHPRSPFVANVAIVALIVILFRDGLEVEAEMLQKAWHLPLRKLVLAMPITGGLVACATKLVTDLSWTESFLLGALLSPTDPVLSSSVVTNPRIPRIVRHSLNLESGLNDGLALAPVLVLVAALRVDRGHFDPFTFVLENIGFGAPVGLVLAFVAARLMPREEAIGRLMPDHQKSLYALGLAFAAYGIAALVPHGNGFIAVFVCGIVLGAAEHEIPETFVAFSENISAIFQVVTFFVFGALIVATGYDGAIWALLVFIPFALLLARPVAVLLSLAGTRLPRPQKAFIAWFGPKGVASMLFALFVLDSEVGPATTLIFDVAAFTILASIIAHGLTDTVGARWIERRMRATG